MFVFYLTQRPVLSTIGGIIGILLGIAIYFIIVYCLGWSFLLSILSILLSFVFSGSVGIFFGFYPARMAARMLPVEALSKE